MEDTCRGWNSYHEDLIRKWAQTSKTYAIMHSLSATKYAKWDSWLGIPVVILGAITASSIFAASHTSSIEVQYANGCLALVAAGLTGVNRFLGYAEKQVKHQNANVKYTAISMEIDSILSFPRDGRTSTPQEFINAMRTSILEIRESSPEVISGIIEDYMVKRATKSLTRVKSKVNRSNVDDSQENSDRQLSPRMSFGVPTSPTPLSPKLAFRSASPPNIIDDDLDSGSDQCQKIHELATVMVEDSEDEDSQT